LIRRISSRRLLIDRLVVGIVVVSPTVDTIKLVKWQGVVQAKKVALLEMNISRPQQ
jgi:hypothetical protein